jgi:hypothetical protein
LLHCQAVCVCKLLLLLLLLLCVSVGDGQWGHLCTCRVCNLRQQLQLDGVQASYCQLIPWPLLPTNLQRQRQLQAHALLLQPLLLLLLPGE